MKSPIIAFALVIAFLPGSVPAADSPSSALDAVLDRPAASLTSEKASLPALFYLVGRSYGINLVVDPTVSGTSFLRFNGGTLRQLLDTLLEANDLFMEEKSGILYIRRTKTEYYFIEYAEIARSASSSTSVSLSPAQSTGLGGYTGIGGAAALPSAALNTGLNNLNGQLGGGSSGSTSFSIAEKSDDSLWSSIDEDIKAQKREDEKIAINRFSGIVTIETTLRRHEFWRQFIELMNERINAQVLVEVRIDEIALNSAHALGVDWHQVQATIGNSGTSVGPITTSTAISNLAGATLPNSTLLGNFDSGKLSAVLTALQQQGSIKTVSTPSLRLLNNQKGFVKVGTDRTFYSLYSNVSINQAGVASQTTTQNVYQGQEQTFGVVLPVTAQIARDGWVTLVLEPARTQLNGVDVSPDGTQTSPETGDQSISTMLRLRDGQSAILGGLISNSESKQTNGIPFLSSIPLLGKLAQTNAVSSTKDELIVTVTVHIIR